MAPGYEVLEYEAGDRESLLKSYPHQREAIIQLTRVGG
jgi:predicted cupin superfamily sugar epimerase